MNETTTTNEAASAQPVGFCQDCGKPLTAETARPVGTGVFCDPCLHVRVASTAGPTASAPYVAGPPVHDASPAAAGWLGLIPGVGAMYNGQYAKGVVHLVIFAVLVSLKENVSDVFGLLVAGWIFYQSFEAYHTAKARRDGTPLPNAFGFNELGDRMGFKNWPGSASHPLNTAARPAPYVPPPPADPAAAGWTPVNQWPTAAAPVPPPVATDSGWVGYVPPTPYAQPQQTAAGTPAAGYAAYARTPYAAVPPATPVTPYVVPDAAYAGRRFPVGALFLIGLGLLFALAEFVPSWHLNGSWLVAVLLGMIAAAAIARRLGHMGGTAYSGVDNSYGWVCAMRGPIMLSVLAVLFLLQALHVATLGQTWPVILLALGALLLVERMTPREMVYPAATTFVPPAAASSVPSPEVRVTAFGDDATTNDATKGGL
jgi:hypothetical protein